jgi:curved DNA-binding protein CbpA
MLNYYDLLEIPRTASKTAILKAGKDLIKQTRESEGGKVGELGHKKILTIELALECLTDVERRKDYDDELTGDLDKQAKDDDDKIDYSQYLLDSSDSWESLLPAGMC